MTTTLLPDQQLHISQTALRASREAEAAAARQPQDAPACAVCPHPLDGHDAIALRFRRATAGAQIDRGCVCRPL